MKSTKPGQVPRKCLRVFFLVMGLALVYNDSQVVYGTEYDYKLTEYALFTILPIIFLPSLDMPLGIMMYYWVLVSLPDTKVLKNILKTAW